MDNKILDMLATITLKDKMHNEQEYWMLRSPSLYDTAGPRSSPSNSSRNIFQQNSKSFHGDSFNYRINVANRSKLKNRFSNGSENSCGSLRGSPSLNEKSQSKSDKI